MRWMWGGAGCAAALTLLIVGACQRRELYVSGDEYYSMLLNVDWSDYDSKNPDGMTVWFYPLENGETTNDADVLTNGTTAPYVTTTANVTRHNLYLPNGRYQGVVINYSPAEYSRQTFHDLNDVHNASVRAATDGTQAADHVLPGALVSDAEQTAARAALYGDSAWSDTQTSRALKFDNGYYQLSQQPEAIGADTLHNRQINSGTGFGDYIPYKQRDSYQQTIQVNELTAVPHTLVWRTIVRVFIKDGLDNLWQTRATLTGLADGHYLARHVNTEQSTMVAIDEWSKEYTGADQGYITANISCFGLRPSTIVNRDDYYPSDVTGKSLYDGQVCDWDAYFGKVCMPGALRLNLIFVLRDQKTNVPRHFDVGGIVSTYDDQLVVEVEVTEDFEDDNGGAIIFPDVTPYQDESAGFGADVEPWQDGGSADETM